MRRFNSPLPGKTPHLHLMLQDIGATDLEIAKFLELTPGTVRKYRRDGQAPRAVMLALFWETSWGRNWRETALQNDAQMAYMQVQFLKHSNARLVKQLLSAEADHKTQKRAANSPFLVIG